MLCLPTGQLKGTLESTYSIASKVSSLALFFAAWRSVSHAIFGRWEEQPKETQPTKRRTSGRAAAKYFSATARLRIFFKHDPKCTNGNSIENRFRKIMYIDIYIYRTHKHVQVLNKPFGSWHLSLSPEYFWIYQNWPYRSSFFVKFPPFPLGPFFLATKPSCNIRIQQSQHLRAVLHGYTQLHLLHLATWKPHHHPPKIRPFHRFSGLGEAAMSSWTNEELSTLVATIVLANPCLEKGEGRMMIRIWKGCFFDKCVD